VPERMSTLNSHRPGMTLIAPPGTFNCPTVPTSPGTFLATLFNCKNHFRRPCGRVVSELHWNGSRMSRGARD